MTKEFTKQETFDIVVGNLIKQGGPSSEVRGDDVAVCMYRSKEGRKCAAGWLIPDEQYSPTFENYAVVGIFDAKNLPLPSSSLEGFEILKGLENALAGHDLKFVSRLQDLHDSLSRSEDYLTLVPDSEWLKKFIYGAKTLAKQNGLKFSFDNE